ncbi:MAG: hypothetical protein HY447_04020 [Candidatus Omnitrophica bacterium]|nr:hypothetical protein [Candidatus Omnitrophota bacterium]
MKVSTTKSCPNESMNKLYQPERIYIEEEARDYPFTQGLLQRLPKIPFEIIQDKESLTRKIRNQSDPIGMGKRFLFLAVDRGKAFKPFPNAEELVSCEFHSLHLVEGCDLECSYCILQAYLTNPFLTVYVNIEEILAKLDSFLKNHLDTPFRIGTGQLADSLSLDHLTAHSEYLVPFFATQTNALLEFKTKSNNIARLEKLKPRERTVVSWSLNTKEIQAQEEHKCASIKERIRAAQLCVRWGYRIGFHFDPLIDLENNLEGYKEVVEEIFSSVPTDRIAWISLGTLRFMPKLKQIMEKRFPKSPLPYAEWVRGVDGKMRYQRQRRIDLYKRLVETIERQTTEVPIYLCMETEEVWNEVFGEKRTPIETVACLNQTVFSSLTKDNIPA